MSGRHSARGLLPVSIFTDKTNKTNKKPAEPNISGTKQLPQISARFLRRCVITQLHETNRHKRFFLHELHIFGNWRRMLLNMLSISPLHCCSCWSSARSSGCPIAWVARGTQVLVFLLPLYTHFHSAARVTLSACRPRSQKVLRKALFLKATTIQNKSFSTSTKHEIKQVKGGGGKNCSGINSTVVSRQLTEPLASASSFKRAVISKLLSRFYRTWVLI